MTRSLIIKIQKGGNLKKFIKIWQASIFGIIIVIILATVRLFIPDFQIIPLIPNHLDVTILIILMGPCSMIIYNAVHKNYFLPRKKFLNIFGYKPEKNNQENRIATKNKIGYAYEKFLMESVLGDIELPETWYLIMAKPSTDIMTSSTKENHDIEEYWQNFKDLEETALKCKMIKPKKLANLLHRIKKTIVDGSI